MEVNNANTNNTVKLIYGDESFIANKDTLSEFSMYFRAMFSGNYIENDMGEISVEAIDPETMGTILLYMNQRFIDLEGYESIKLERLAKAANFLQMEELMTQIKYTFLNRMTESNWLEIKALAEAIQSDDLERATVTYGLLSFHSMKVENIAEFQTLHWYLSHPYLDVDNEYQVFKFGFDWILKHESSADAFLIILSCLDLTELTFTDLNMILKLLKDYEHSLVAKMIKCLNFLLRIDELDVDKLIAQKDVICEKYTEYVYNEVLELMKCNRTRRLNLIPCVSLYPGPTSSYREDSDEESTGKKKKKLHKQDRNKEQARYVYQYKDDNLIKWLDVDTKRLWGWSLTTWDKTKLVIVGGEYFRGSGRFNKQVAVFDMLSEKWERHSATLPDRRHAGVAVLGNRLFITGGCSTYRVLLSKCIVYDLVQRCHESIADIPEPMQSPAMCSHEGSVYLSSVRDIYKYEEGEGEREGRWALVLKLRIRANQLVSFENYIYLTQYYHHELNRFNPGTDENLESVAQFKNAVCTMCRAGRQIFAFTQSMLTYQNLFVEMYKNGETHVLWKDEDNHLIIYDAGGSCSLIAEKIPQHTEVSAYSKKYMALLNMTEN